MKSVKTLLYMRKNVPGMKISQEYIDRMHNASEPQEVGLKIAVEIIDSLKQINGVRGIHILPVMWESIVPTLVTKIQKSI